VTDHLHIGLDPNDHISGNCLNILEIIKMDNTNTSPKTSSDAMKMIQKDIKAKWDKFSEQELASLKSRDDLVTQVVAKYGFERPQAQRDVDALLKGREIGLRA
jgi:hypothetical protein